ncbi:MAG: hypothetical protein MSIBF_01895 [Candidatus Altiarchaeales archaeon IMC4]|nr:MAG: hypothetical protein MSIBF_01895 [Candidatus Altiarchaeales archaeon IMC4]
MKSVKILAVIVVFLVCGCIDGKQNVAEIKYVCTDGMVAEHQSECRTAEEKICPATAAATEAKYVCPDSALVGNPSDCKTPEATCQNETVCVCPGDREGTAQNRSLETKSVCPECVCPKTECNLTCMETNCVCPQCILLDCPKQVCTTCSSGSGSSIEITDLSLTQEWVEIKNNGNSAVDTVGWTLGDDAATPHVYTFPEFSLMAGTSVRVNTNIGTDTATNLYWGRKTGVWNDDGDTATLKNAQGEVVSELQKP